MEQWTQNQHFSKIHLWPCQELLQQDMREEAGLRKCKARGGEEMGLSAGISVDSVFSGDWFSKAWDMTVWPPNMVQTWWSTLFETNKDVKIDGKKRHPRLFSGRVLINVPISMLVSKCGFYIGNPRAMFVVFYGFTFCNTLSKIYVSGFASWQIQMNIYVSGFVMYVALNFQHLC